VFLQKFGRPLFPMFHPMLWIFAWDRTTEG
jgi:hypothetical protein